MIIAIISTYHQLYKDVLVIRAQSSSAITASVAGCHFAISHFKLNSMPRDAPPSQLG
jgi:hypothetical protein